MIELENINFLSPSDLDRFSARRKGEVKLGEKIIAGSTIDHFSNLDSSYVIFGVPEDIGIRANRGIPGASNTWIDFLKAFCSIQFNSFNKAVPVILGNIHCEDLMAQAGKLNSNAEDYYEYLGELVEELDKRVADTVRHIVSAGKIPIAVGGGHNNAYGMLQGASEGKGKSLNAVNFDAHTDYRRLEERHSGNGFSYARSRGYLANYHVHGLQKNYTPDYIFEQFEKEEGLSYFLREVGKVTDLNNEMSIITGKLKEWVGPFGIELDCDVIDHFSSSAISPSGYSLDEVRYLMGCLASSKPCYYHICEADSSNDRTVGKALAYIVSDILRH